MTDPTEKKIKITMSERAPLKILAEDWPVVAEARWHSGELECQANEEAFIRVREHSDGRRIVYSDRDRGPGGMPIKYRGTAGGYLVDALPRDVEGRAGGPDEDGTVRAIRRAVGVIGMLELADECIADLPAQDFT